MKYLKMIAIATVAAMALMAFAGTASATVLESGSTRLVAKDTIKFSLSGSSVLRHNETVLNECSAGQFTSQITNAGGVTSTVSGPNKTIDFESCESEVHVVSLGTLEVHHIANTNDGTLMASGIEIANTIFGTSCVYVTGTGKDLGNLDGVSSGNASIAINITVSEVGGKFLCPDTANWTATFNVTSPSPLQVTAS